MSDSAKFLLGLFTYLTMSSVFFGVAFSGNRKVPTVVVAFGSMAIAQIAGFYVMRLVQRLKP